MTAKPEPNRGPVRLGPAPSPVAGRPQAGEQFFQQSIADLSRRLDERAGKEGAGDPQAAAEERRRAMRAYERERARKLRLALGGAGAVLATAGIAWFVVLLGQPDAPAEPSHVASTLPIPTPAAPTTPAVVTASAAPAPEPPRPEAPPPPSSPAPETAPVTEVQPPPAPSSPPSPPAYSPPPAEPQTVAVTPPVQPAPSLSRDEIREVQKRLRGFGFNPGAIDGVAGRQTEIATERYLETRGQPQMPPTERALLEQLRQDSNPQVVQTPVQVAQRPVQSDGRTGQASNSGQQPQRGSFDPFQPVKIAGAEITRFLQSVFH